MPCPNWTLPAKVREEKQMFLDARAPGTRGTDPRQVPPDGRPDAGRAALRAVLRVARGFPRSGCSPHCSLFHRPQMGLRCSFVIWLSPFGRFLPRNPCFRKILRFSNIWQRQSQSESPSHRQQPWKGDSYHQGRGRQTVYTVPGLFPVFSRTWQKEEGSPIAPEAQAAHASRLRPRLTGRACWRLRAGRRPAPQGRPGCARRPSPPTADTSASPS